jgi:uncharacterized RDD family membrane protein YckC
VSTASVPPPGWVEPQRPAATSSPPSPFASPERPDGTGFAATIAREDRRRLDTKRVCARFIDNLICVPIYFLALYEWDTAVLLAWTIMSLVHVVVAHFCEVTIGATPGKYFLRLRVADRETGALPSPRQAAIRGVIGIFESNLIGLIALHVSKGRTRLGDRAAGTVVVDTVRHPAEFRGLTGGALVYGLAWAIPFALVALGVHKHHASASYVRQADALCRQADATINARLASEGLPAVVAAYQQLDAGLAQLHPPGAWLERHRRLAGQVHANAAGLAGRVRAASADPARADWESLASIAEGQYALMKHQARVDGYVDCGR